MAEQPFTLREKEDMHILSELLYGIQGCGRGNWPASAIAGLLHDGFGEARVRGRYEELVEGLGPDLLWDALLPEVREKVKHYREIGSPRWTPPSDESRFESLEEALAWLESLPSVQRATPEPPLTREELLAAVAEDIRRSEEERQDA